MKGETPTARLSASRFEDLRIWQAARELTRGVYRAVQKQKLGQDFALSGQMKRAAVSIGSNIAEGFELGTRKQEIEQCFVAKGSAGELRSQVITARDVGLIDAKAYAWLHEKCETVSRMLHAYIVHLRRTVGTRPGHKYRADDLIEE